MTLSSFFSKRRTTRLLGAVFLLVGFFLVQWEEREAVLPPPAPAEVEEDTFVSSTVPFVFFPTPFTTGTQGIVTRAVDGDTLEVQVNGEEAPRKVRLLGVDTPETVDPRRPVQCYGKEASNYMKQLVEGKTVFLVEDVKADDRDTYGRWLRNIVRAEDRVDVNATLIKHGYAHAYLSFPLDGKRKAELRGLEEEAKTALRGLWSPSTCGGKK